MKLFWLNRHKDLSGVSGEGIVAQGVIFENGQVVMRWRGRHSSLVIYDNIKQVDAIHGHRGLTDIVYDDDPRAIQLLYLAQREVQKKDWELGKAIRGLEKLRQLQQES